MLPKRRNKDLFVWLFKATTHASQPRGEVDSRTGYITVYSGGTIPRPWHPPDQSRRKRREVGRKINPVVGANAKSTTGDYRRKVEIPRF